MTNAGNGNVVRSRDPNAPCAEEVTYKIELISLEKGSDYETMDYEIFSKFMYVKGFRI